MEKNTQKIMNVKPVKLINISPVNTPDELKNISLSNEHNYTYSDDKAFIQDGIDLCNKMQDAMHRYISYFLKRNESLTSNPNNPDEVIEIYPLMIKNIEQTLISSVMKYCGNNKNKASKILGINRKTLSYKIKNLSISIDED